jgi:ABC-type transport system involved in Fe-S cluster assembly fused permease/ATPase subunit
MQIQSICLHQTQKSQRGRRNTNQIIYLFIQFYIFSNVSIIISFYVWITYLLCHCKCFCPWNCICSLVNFTFYSFQFLFSFQCACWTQPTNKQINNKAAKARERHISFPYRWEVSNEISKCPFVHKAPQVFILSLQYRWKWSERITRTKH